MKVRDNQRMGYEIEKKAWMIDALKWTGYNYTQAELFMGQTPGSGRYEAASPERGNGWRDGAYGNSACLITTLEGVMRCEPGDWIIKGVNGEFYPCKPDIFAKIYEPVEE